MKGQKYRGGDFCKQIVMKYNPKVDTVGEKYKIDEIKDCALESPGFIATGFEKAKGAVTGVFKGAKDAVTGFFGKAKGILGKAKDSVESKNTVQNNTEQQNKARPEPAQQDEEETYNVTGHAHLRPTPGGGKKKRKYSKTSNKKKINRSFVQVPKNY